ncbi:MAG: glycosyltransferase family 2 protein [Clostridia bacterium]|nr:glycosyltransferase family 2 protein [Clostridia bacterium]
MNEAKISIIVPIYDSEEYLRECLDSLVNQTMKQIEIILVNDASPDHSDIIMEEYREKYRDIIKCIYLPVNLKQGGARNVGVNAANGDYIMFIDADDYVDITICEKMYKLADSEKYDLICSGYRMFGKQNREIDLFPDDICGELNDTVRKAIISIMSVGSVAKLIRKSIWIDNQLSFTENMKYEDLATMPLVWMYIKSVGKIDEPLYFYRRHQESTTLKENSVHTYQIFNAAQIAADRLRERGFAKDYSEEIEAIAIRGFMDEIKCCIQNMSVINTDELMQMRTEILDKYKDYENNRYFFLRSEPMEINAARCFINSFDSFVEKHADGTFAKEDTHYYSYYDLQKDQIIAMLQSYCALGQHIAIWGSGKKGMDFLSVVDPKCQYIEAVIDKNETKWGTYTDTGHKVYSYGEICTKIDVILVMNRFYFNSIRREVHQVNREVELVDMDMYIIRSLLGWG